MRKLITVSQSYLLFARPSFWEGIARVLDFGSTLQNYNRSFSPEQADLNALRSDWRVVGQDIEFSIKKYGQAKEPAIPDSAHAR